MNSKRTILPTLPIALFALLALGCPSTESESPSDNPYVSFSRFTDSGDRADMLDVLPETPTEIAAVASHLTVHHNLLAHYGVPKEQWPAIRSVWPPKVPDILAALSETGPRDLSGERDYAERVRGGCMLESHLLAGMLRHKGIPVRLRAGYFRDVYTNEDHLVAFWEKNARERGIAAQLLEEDPDEWLRVNHEYTRSQVEVNKCVEHWVAEYWDKDQNGWRILDANKGFLKAMSGIEVGYILPRRHFEYAYESWQKMRTAENFNPDQYAEWPQDGRSHIRSQLLWDFYSLLNHDIAGYDRSLWPDSDSLTTPERDTYAFVKERTYEELTPQELEELDQLAELLSRDPTINDLVNFHHNSTTLQIPTAEADPYSFLAASSRH